MPFADKSESSPLPRGFDIGDGIGTCVDLTGKKRCHVREPVNGRGFQGCGVVRACDRIPARIDPAESGAQMNDFQKVSVGRFGIDRQYRETGIQNNSGVVGVFVGVFFVTNRKVFPGKDTGEETEVLIAAVVDRADP